VIDSNFLASQPIDTIVDMMISGKVKNSDLETIYQSDPMRYEEIKAKTGKKQQESIINQKKTDYVKSLDEVTNKIDSVKVE
jgi:3-deoxy-D-arabino-heptulosonate 7-phosphate (DAHP) synthase class II